MVKEVLVLNCSTKDIFCVCFGISFLNFAKYKFAVWYVYQYTSHSLISKPTGTFIAGEGA